MIYPPRAYYCSNVSNQSAQALEEDVRAPASRRAASTGGIGLSSVSSNDNDQRSYSPSSQAWEPGMPLPPPPPGPPPAGNRSQSMSRTFGNASLSSRGSDPSDGSETMMAAPAPRRPVQHGTRLGPIPPTPAGWIDDDARHAARSPMPNGLSLDTSSVPKQSSDGEMSRVATMARHELGQRGIRERRIEGRVRSEGLQVMRSAVEPRSTPWSTPSKSDAPAPPDLVLPSNHGSISRRRAVRKSPQLDRKFHSPRSPGDGVFGRVSSSSQSKTKGQLNGSESPAGGRAPQASANTPPFSPSIEGLDNQSSKSQPHDATSKALPTPPTQRNGEDSFAHGSAGLTIFANSNDRPVSHILHAPNEDMKLQPLSPSRTPSDAPKPSKISQPSEADDFATASIDRHKKFIEHEMNATDDRERLELFSAFIINESRLRRDRYSSAFDSMAGEIFDLTRDIWRPYNGGRCSTTPTGPLDSQHDRQNHDVKNTSSMGSSCNPTPRDEMDSSSNQVRTRDGQSWSGYQPVLSPIPSMAMSAVPDDEDSRGRSASRWWEASINGSLGHGSRIERTKRESKYMGVPKEAREGLQWHSDTASLSNGGVAGPSDSTSSSYGLNEYPPEKTGWHDQIEPSVAPSPQATGYLRSTPNTPDPYKLDISRLVTLPPPYPRHHPALNNNHPELASIRTNLRLLNDREGLANVRMSHREKLTATSQRDVEATENRRIHLRSRIQDQIKEGAMSFAQAAKAEADFEALETRKISERAQSDYHAFEKDVFGPLQALYSKNILKANTSIDHLKSGLFKDAQSSDPTSTQVEGDEEPELLEKLTLLKWFFEAREHLHIELFEMEKERSEYYKNVVVVPYRLAGSEDKAYDAEQFFFRDNRDRKLEFEKQAVQRFEDVLSVIEENVTRGVEDQLSAFWDIAPGLLATVQKVPQNLSNLDILIPTQEYAENLSYYDFPAQYLHSLLIHAEKSAYQFIESQTNLLCLLHEVKNCVMIAGSRLLEMQRQLAGEDFSSVEREMKAVRDHEERRLTDDLKEKVALVEGQWGEALGKGLEDCKHRVKLFLVEQGGWDDNLQE